MPLYGRTYILKDTKNNGIGAPVRVDKNGELGYYEICQIQRNKNLKIHHVKRQKAPYIVDCDKWITYDSSR